VESGFLKIVFVDSKDNKADMFMKLYQVSYKISIKEIMSFGDKM
jgi:hypothetical protein